MSLGVLRYVIKALLLVLSGVPVPEATTHVVSLPFISSSSSSSDVLEMLCSTGTSPDICMIFFRHWTHSFFPFSSETLE